MIRIPPIAGLAILTVATVALLPACTKTTNAKPTPKSGSPGVVIPAEMFVAAAPEGAVGVKQAIGMAKAGSELVVRAVIGGRKKAFVDGRAMLVAADTALKPCPDEEGCPTPWDYCCDTPETLRANTMTIQIVDAKGTPLATTLKGVHGLKELETIVVAGSVRSTEGSLVLDAKKIHVEKD